MRRGALAVLATGGILVLSPPVLGQVEPAETLTTSCEEDRDADLCMAMAIRTYEGRSVTMDHVLSRRFSAMACEEGKLVGCNLLAALLQDGAGGAQDLEGAAHHFRRACDGGYNGACFNLGQLRYNHHSGEPEHLHEARTMFAKGCDGGFAKSCNNQAVMLQRGEGGDRDLAAARTLFERACDAGEVDACTNFGVMLLTEEGGPSDAERAVSLLGAACRMGSSNACQTLDSRPAQQ